MAIIILSGMEFFAYHGCFAEEQIIGNKFIIDLEISADTENAEVSDMLKKTVNYQKVYELVKAEMEIKSKLLEHVARRIVDAVYNHFSEIKHVKVTVAKINPALGGKVEKVSVTIEKENRK